MATLIGITGQIGSGKSTAAAVFKKLGAAVINADQIGRHVVESNPKLRKLLSKTFGREVLTPKGNLRRQRVAEIAFSSRANKIRLDKLVHPFLLKELRRQIAMFSKSHEVIVIDAALLLDWNLDKILDQVLVINANSERRLSRVTKRGISTADARSREKLQLAFSEYERRADRIIPNDFAKSEFEKKVRNWARQFFRSN